VSARSGVWVAAGLALALGLAGISWGLPARWHPDEKADVAAEMALAPRLRPDSFINPSLPLYVMAPALWLQARLAQAGMLRGRAADALLVGRALSALAGAAAVYLLGRAALRTHPPLGALPAFLLALMPGAVNLCHFATPEAWLLLGTAATLGLALGHLRGEIPAGVLGLVLGLTASTKYTAAAFLVPALAAVWLRDLPDRPQSRRHGWLAVIAGGLLAGGLALALGGAESLAARLHLKDARLLHAEHALGFVRGVQHALLAVGAGLVLLVILAPRQRWAARLAREEVAPLMAAAAAGFLIGTPYALLDPQAFLSDLAFNHQTRFEYKGLVGASTSYVAYLRLLADALTGPFFVATAAGVVVAAGRASARDRVAVVLLAAFLAPYLLVASSGHQALRFLAPVLPAAAWLAAMGLAVLPSAAARRAAALLVLGRAALGSVLVVRLFFVDSRLAARRWIEVHVPPGATVDLIANIQGYAPALPPGRTLRVVPTLGREMAPAERFAEAAARYPAEASPWLLLTASYYERFLEHPEQKPERTAFFRDLLEGRGGFEVVARFRQQGWLRPPVEFVDPEIVILVKKGALAARPLEPPLAPRE
jgi:hypothetical protein